MASSSSVRDGGNEGLGPKGERVVDGAAGTGGWEGKGRRGHARRLLGKAKLVGLGCGRIHGNTITMSKRQTKG